MTADFFRGCKLKVRVSVAHHTKMSPYLPRPDIDRVTQDVDEIYILAAEELQQSMTPEERRNAFKQAMLRSYDAGVDAQREIVRDYEHDRPTPVPQLMPSANEHSNDPGTLPPGPRPRSRTPRPRPSTLPYRIPKPGHDD